MLHCFIGHNHYIININPVNEMSICLVTGRHLFLATSIRSFQLMLQFNFYEYILNKHLRNSFIVTSCVSGEHL